MKSRDLGEIWDDQLSFNRNFFPAPITFDDRSKQTKEYALHLISEVDELLRQTAWKMHRGKGTVQENRAAVKDELTDIFKYWISLCIVWGVSPESALDDYWRKSMVVRQRYAEEYMMSLEGPSAIIDIDNVLADYTTGFLDWCSKEYPQMKVLIQSFMLTHKGAEMPYFMATDFHLDEGVWQEVKHRFRTSGGKLNLPVIEGAKEFLHALKERDMKIILLTSRPIDRYPNIYTDTLEWLQKNELPYDFVWWSTEKHEAILMKGIRHSVRFAVDDNFEYAIKMAHCSIRTYLMQPRFIGDNNGRVIEPNLLSVSTFKRILELEFNI